MILVDYNFTYFSDKLFKNHCFYPFICFVMDVLFIINKKLWYILMVENYYKKVRSFNSLRSILLLNLERLFNLNQPNYHWRLGRTRHLSLFNLKISYTLRLHEILSLISDVVINEHWWKVQNWDKASIQCPTLINLLSVSKVILCLRYTGISIIRFWLWHIKNVLIWMGRYI